MSKLSKLILASLAFSVSTVPAFAHSGFHLITDAGKTSFTIEGDASLGSNNCSLVLEGEFVYNTSGPGGHPHTPPAGKAYYNEVKNLVGYNLPLPFPYSPTCAGISITGGDGRVTGPNTLTIDNLIIQVGSASCNAGPVAVAATNLTNTIEVSVNQFAPACGQTIKLDGESDATVQIG